MEPNESTMVESVEIPDNLIYDESEVESKEPVESYKMTMDDYAALSEQEAGKALWSSEPDEPYKGIDTKKELASAPENIQKLFANLNADYRKKTQALAAEKRQLAAERKAMFDSEAFKKLKAEAESTEDIPLIDHLSDPEAYSQAMSKRTSRDVSQKTYAVLNSLKEAQEEAAIKADTVTFMEERKEYFSDKNFENDMRDILLSSDITFPKAFDILKKQYDADRKLRRIEREIEEGALRDSGYKISKSSNISGKQPAPKNILKDPMALYEYEEEQYRLKQNARR